MTGMKIGDIKKNFLKIVGRTYKGKRKKKIIFILNAGRCGSTSIVRMLNQNLRFIAFHEAMPEFIRLSTVLAENPQKKECVVSEIKKKFKDKFWEANKDQIIVHSDHRMWNMVGTLNDYFPNAYFIHLIRNPYDSVKSIVPREWYSKEDHGNSFSKYRLKGDKVNDVEKEEWQSWNDFDKSLWYWNFVNKNISKQLNSLPQNRKMTLRIEEILETFNGEFKNIFKLEEKFVFEPVKVNTTEENNKEKNLPENFNEEFLKSYLKKRNDLYLNEYPDFEKDILRNIKKENS